MIPSKEGLIMINPYAIGYDEANAEVTSVTAEAEPIQQNRSAKSKIADAVIFFFKLLIPIIILVPFTYFSYKWITGMMEYRALENPSFSSGEGVALWMFLSCIILFCCQAAAFTFTVIATVINALNKRSPKRSRNEKILIGYAVSPTVVMLIYLLLLAIA